MGRAQVEVACPHRVADVVVRLDAGSVVLEPSDEAADNPVSGGCRLSWSWLRPTVEQDCTGATFSLIARGRRWRAGVIHVRLSVPAEAAVDVRMRFGSVRIGALRGPVGVRLQAGGIEARGTCGDLDLSTGAAGIEAWDLRSRQVRAEAPAGAIALAFAQVPEAVEAWSQNEPVDIAVPPGAYEVDATGSRVVVEVERAEGGPWIGVASRAAVAVREARQSAW